MNLFDLAAKISLDDSSFNNGISNAEKAGKNLGNSLQNSFSKIQKAAKVLVSGVAIKKGIDMMTSLAKETAAAGDRIDKQSQVLGMSRKAYQEWDYILSQNGTSIDSMNTAMKTLNSTMLSAKDGGEEAKNAFAKLGLGIHEIENMSMEDQFEAVVKAFQKMPAGANKSALAVKLFGKNGMELLPLLNNSATSIDELREKAQELGLIMSDDAVDASVAYSDALDTMQRTFNGLKYSIGSKVMPVLTSAMTSITGYAGKIRNAYEEKGLAGVFETVVNDIKNIKWPTWDDVRGALTRAWDTVKEGAKTVLKLVFGEDADGGITWPSAAELWEKYKSTLTRIWNTIGTLARDVLVFVFGEDENGGIKWPTAAEIWEKVKTGFTTLWEGLKTMAQDLLVLVFGEDENGGIKWSTAEEVWEKVKSGLEALWSGIQELAKGIFKFVFGEGEDGGIQWPTASELFYKIGQGLRTLWNGVKELAKDIFTFVFGESSGGGIEWPSADELWAKIKEGLTALWEGVKELAKSILNLGLGFFELPDIDSIVKQINEWWENIKKKISLTLFFNVMGGYSSFGYDPSSGQTWSDQAMETNKKFGFPSADLSQYDPSFFTDEHAKGSWNIPFDNYVAKLHRGEMVLTASQARKYRDGDSGMDIGQIAAAVRDAVITGMSGATVKSYLSGRDVTDDVNRNTVRQLKARRFAT